MTTHKKDLIKEVANKLNLSEKETKEVVEQFLETMIDTLIKDGRLELRGLGVFEIRQRKAKTVRNIKTGKLCLVKAYNGVEYKTSQVIKKKLNIKENTMNIKSIATIFEDDERQPENLENKSRNLPIPEKKYKRN